MMGFLNSSPTVTTPPPPPTPPPAATPATYASSDVQASGQAAKNRMAAAAGAGFSDTLFTSLRGDASSTTGANTAQKQLLGT